jgi:hypothetical protein
MNKKPTISNLANGDQQRRTTFAVPLQRDRFDGWGPRVHA